MKITVETESQEFEIVLSRDEPALVRRAWPRRWFQFLLHCAGVSGRGKRRDRVVLGKSLHWYLSLAGASNVQTCPLSASTETPIQPYRYDWIVGLSCSAIENKWWHWQAALRSEDALKVQVLIECPKGIAWSDLSAQLLALHPSRDTTSWFEQNAPAMLYAARSIAKVAGSTIPGLALGGEILNAIPSDAGKRLWLFKRKKYWFLYRYYDPEAQCPALEWVISKNVIQQYGPMLRGSVVLAFHGAAEQENAQAALGLRAGLGFLEAEDLKYARPGNTEVPTLRLSLKFDQQP